MQLLKQYDHQSTFHRCFIQGSRLLGNLQARLPRRGHKITFTRLPFFQCLSRFQGYLQSKKSDQRRETCTISRIRHDTARSRTHEYGVFSWFFVEFLTKKVDEKIGFWRKNTPFWDDSYGFHLFKKCSLGSIRDFLTAFVMNNTLVFVKFEKMTVEIELSCFFSVKYS